MVPNIVFWQLPKSRLDVMMQEYKAEAYKDLQRRIEDHNLPPFLPYGPIRVPEPIPKSRLDVMMQEYKAKAYIDLQRQIEDHNLPPFLPYGPIRVPDRIHKDVDGSVWEGPVGRLYRRRVRQSSETGGGHNDPILVEDDVDVVRLTCLAYRPRHGGYSL